MDCRSSSRNRKKVGVVVVGIENVVQGGGGRCRYRKNVVVVVGSRNVVRSFHSREYLQGRHVVKLPGRELRATRLELSRGPSCTGRDGVAGLGWRGEGVVCVVRIIIALLSRCRGSSRSRQSVLLGSYSLQHGCVRKV
jgi:hypothetical protein